MFLTNSQTVELANLLFLAFSPLCIGCARDSTGSKGSGNIAGFEKSFLSALLTKACHRGLSFLLFPPYLLLKTGLCFICSIWHSLLHLSNAHLANAWLISSSDLILKQKTKAKERKSCTRYFQTKVAAEQQCSPPGRMKNQTAASLYPVPAWNMVSLFTACWKILSVSCSPK